ncbi:sugar phosphate isomerase/epimerase family protein [Carnimonas nigrificans]|uniref:sugar phosphate isomerase/epimerase family protein n=1 Tax=Carnimonas nigrificans TaxID=64323 RepID=UPI00047056F8|nr:sugar phosphate isomerase/epimerase family protein [Carnimonas nigrificans]
MTTALHGITTVHGNLMTDIRLAAQSGFDMLEIYYPKLTRYLANGGTIERLNGHISAAGLTTGYVSALNNIECYETVERQALLKEAETITRLASQLGCDTVMVMPREEANRQTVDHLMDSIVRNMTDIAAIGRNYGIRYMLELPAFTPYRSIALANETIERVGADNVGIVLDFWHFFAAGDTPDDIARLDPSRIYCVHFGDGRVPRADEAWDENILRAYYPGEGEIDLRAWAAATNACGYQGPWSIELISPALWEEDPALLLPRLNGVMREYMGA